MQTSYSQKMIQGIISLFYVYPDGRWDFIRKVHNDILYSGASVMAKAIVGTPGIKIGGMYMEFTNAGDSPDAIDRSRPLSYYEGLTGSRGYSRVPLTASPGFSAYDTNYEDNIVTVQAQTNGTYETATVFEDGVSVISAALVAMPDPADKTQDILFSAGNLDAPVPKIANAQIGIKWDVKFR